MKALVYDAETDSPALIFVKERDGSHSLVFLTEEGDEAEGVNFPSRRGIVKLSLQLLRNAFS